MALRAFSEIVSFPPLEFERDLDLDRLRRVRLAGERDLERPLFRSFDLRDLREPEFERLPLLRDFERVRVLLFLE
jgi:hypothetical protein